MHAVVAHGRPVAPRWAARPLSAATRAVRGLPLPMAAKRRAVALRNSTNTESSSGKPKESSRAKENPCELARVPISSIRSGRKLRPSE